MIMAAQSTSSIETVHVTQPIYSNRSQVDGTAIKRKMTVSLIPFTTTEAGTADIRIGLTSLMTTGAYPGTGPYATPFYDVSNTCVSNGADNEQRGMSYFVFKNNGDVVATTCVVTGVSGNKVVLESGLNPTLYTVLTVETYGIFCRVCIDNMLPNTGWTYFRAYQRDTSGNLISSTDKNLNFTSGITPLFQTSYAFISQMNSNGAATGQTSKIDLVEVQNYGSPVCLSVPGGTLCTRLPPIPVGLGQGLISDIAWLANQIGFGDEQIGAIIMFLILSTGFAFIPFILTRNYLIGGTGLLLVFTFFIYAGFLPTWMLFIPILFGGVLGVLLVNRLLGSHTLMGGGGSENG
jgi:hypothetical protein